MKDERGVDCRANLIEQLGSMHYRWYRVVWIALAVSLFVLLYWLAIEPICCHMTQGAQVSRELLEYELRREELSRQVSNTQTVGHKNADGFVAESTIKEDVLERVHRTAGHVGLLITDFTRDNVLSSDSSNRRGEAHFTARGIFLRLSEFIRLMGAYESEFGVSAIVIENEKWPDFDGELRMRVVLRTEFDNYGSEAKPSVPSR